MTNSYLAGFNKNRQLFLEKLSYKKVFLLLFVICFLYILPIILANTFYIDDMNRTVEGYNWNRDGRFMSSNIMHLLSSQIEVVYSLFPYSTIVSTFFLALTGFVLTYSLGIKNKLHLITSSLIVATCPFLLEILTYKFDCLPISLSILFAVLPFLLYQYKLRFFVASFLFLYLIFGLYQTTALSYAMVLCLFLIKDIWSLRYRNILISGLLAVTAFVLAFFYYQYRLNQLGIEMVDTQRSEFIFSSPNFKVLLVERWEGYKTLLFSLIKSSYRYAIYIVCIASVFGVGLFLIKQKFTKHIILQITASILLIAFVLALSVSINLVVMEPRWSPRSLIGGAFVLLMCFYAVVQIPKRVGILANIVFIPVIYYAFLISSQLGIFLRNQDEYSDFISAMIAPEVLKHNDLKLIIDGSIQYAPRNATVKNETMPFIYKLAPLYEHYEFYWGIIRMNKFAIMSNTYVFGEERANVLASKESFPKIQENKYYTLRIQPPYAVVTFH